MTGNYFVATTHRVIATTRTCTPPAADHRRRFAGQAPGPALLGLGLESLTFGYRSGERVAIFVTDVHVAIAPTLVVCVPDDRCLDRGPRHERALEQVQRESHDEALRGGVVGLPAGVAEREVDEHEARDTALLDDVSGRADHHGRDAGLLDLSCSQAHGLVTDRSKRHHHDDVDVVGA